MATRDLLNYLGQKIGDLSEPDGVTWTEEQWTEKLAKAAKAPPDQSEIVASYLKNTIKQRKEYAEDLLERLKQKNISEGINAMQGMWMHHKMRALEVNFMGVDFVVDIMNMAVSGDVEIACLALMNCVADPMTLPYHWMSEARINWIIADMKAYLGWS